MKREWICLLGMLLLAAGCASRPHVDSGVYERYATLMNERMNQRAALMNEHKNESSATAVPSGGAVVDLRDSAEREKDDEIVHLEPWTASALGLKKTEMKRSEWRRHLKTLGLQEVDANGNPVDD